MAGDTDRSARRAENRLRHRNDADHRPLEGSQRYRPFASRTVLEPRVLIADDQSDVLEGALRLLLKAEGSSSRRPRLPPACSRPVEAREFDVALIDLNYARDTTSGEEGLNLLSRIQGLDPTLPVVVMTAWGSVEVAVEAMRRRARDFIQKPWDNARLLSIIRTQIELSQALRKGQRLEGRELAAAAKACRTSWPNRRPCRTCCR